MSDISFRGGATPETTFRTATVLLMLAVGILGFLGMFVLGAYAPDMGAGRNGGPHALSDGATGYSGLVKLARSTGRNPRIIRNKHFFASEDLLVLTPGSAAVDIAEPLRQRHSRATLLILPKWLTLADPDHRGWVRRLNLLPIPEPEGVLAPSIRLHVRRHPSAGKSLVTDKALPPAIQFRAPRPLQVITGIEPGRKRDKAGDDNEQPFPGTEMTPLVTDGQGGIIVAQIGEGPLYVVVDPDLFDNRGMKAPVNAKSALLLLDWMNSTGATGIDFDVTLNGLAHSPSPLKLALEPPFLAMTLTIFAALGMAGLHAFVRFGPPRLRTRAIAFGKLALVDNSAALVGKAGRELRLGGRYVAAIRDLAVRAFGVPQALRDAELDAYLDNLDRRTPFTQFARAVEMARDRQALIDAAGGLHDWLKEKSK